MDTEGIQESLTTVSLEDILSPEEISQLKKNKSFKEDIYEKKSLILKLISLAIQTFEKSKTAVLAKSFKWVKKELESNLEIHPDKDSILKFEKNSNKPSMRMSLGWVKEFSALSKANHIYTMINNSGIGRKILHKPALSHDLASLKMEKPEEKLMKRNSLNSEEIMGGIYKKFLGTSDQQFEKNNFNIFEFSQKIGQENVLPVITVYVLQTYKLFNIIPYFKFEKLIYEIANGYHRNNPYHTDLHAADMVQTLFLFNINAKFQNILNMSELDLFSMFFAASIHDLGHPGFSNNYLVNTKDQIAIQYNDKSVLENYHVSQAFKLIYSKPELNIFANMISDDYKMCRQNIIEYVLHTDMTLHNKQFKSFKLRLETYDIKKGQNIEKLFDESDPIASYQIKMEFSSFLLHSADISNPTKPLDIYKQWAQRCVDEFFVQGDMEKDKGLVVSFNCDRNTVSLPQSQLGFIEAIVYPLYTVVNEYFPQLSFTLDNIKKNKEYFQKVRDGKIKYTEA